MGKLFPKQYFLSWLAAAALFGLLFPYRMFAQPDLEPVYPVFCVVLNGISICLFRAILFRAWVKRFYPEQIRVYAWFLAVQAFCHLVFTRMHPMCWVAIGITVVIWSGMAAQWWKQWKKERKEGKKQ